MYSNTNKVGLTREELLFRLRQIAANQEDIEIDHSRADSLLIEFIDDEEIAQAYSNIRKWYA